MPEACNATLHIGDIPKPSHVFAEHRMDASTYGGCVADTVAQPDCERRQLPFRGFSIESVVRSFRLPGKLVESSLFLSADTSEKPDHDQFARFRFIGE